MQLWSEEHDVELLLIQPGKPTQNAFIESFNNRVRCEFLNTQLVPHASPSPAQRARVAASLQHDALAQRARLSNARGVPRDLRNYPTSTEISGCMTGPTLGV
jgi:transposase InsO family protein